jgi:hypothetical protein
MKQIPKVPNPEDFTSHTEEQWNELLLGPVPTYIFCPQGSHMVQKEDYDPRAGMCGACINQAMADVPEFFARGGLVASAEENEAND